MRCWWLLAVVEELHTVSLPPRGRAANSRLRSWRLAAPDCGVSHFSPISLWWGRRASRCSRSEPLCRVPYGNTWPWVQRLRQQTVITVITAHRTQRTHVWVCFLFSFPFSSPSPDPSTPVSVGYEYESCPGAIQWERRTAPMHGFELVPSNLGGWSLDKHHALNMRSGESR